MTDKDVVTEIINSGAKKAGFHFILDQLPREENTDTFPVREINRLDRTLYRGGFTADIEVLSPDKVRLNSNGGHVFELTSTDGISLYINKEGSCDPLSFSQLKAGVHKVMIEAVGETHLTDISCAGLDISLVDSDYIDEPYYKGSITGFIKEGTPNSVQIVTEDNNEYLLRQGFATAAGELNIYYITPEGGRTNLDSVRTIEGGLAFPE